MPKNAGQFTASVEHAKLRLRQVVVTPNDVVAFTHYRQTLWTTS